MMIPIHLHVYLNNEYIQNVINVHMLVLQVYPRWRTYDHAHGRLPASVDVASEFVRAVRDLHKTCL